MSSPLTYSQRRTDWFDVSDSESETPLSPLLPTPEIHFDPITNTKTITTWHISPTTSLKIRTVRKFRVHPQHAQQERIRLHASFIKFGAEKGNPSGIDQTTTSLSDNIPFYIGPDWREETWKPQFQPPDSKAVICRICKGEHYTMHCISKSSVPVEDSNDKYIPPCRREELFSPNESTCIRVTGLSQQITQEDFTARFMRFGKITRVFLPRDYLTGDLRGYGYVTFQRREEAQRAMETMDGRGYDNLIMHIAWDERPPPPTTFRQKLKI